LLPETYNGIEVFNGVTDMKEMREKFPAGICEICLLGLFTVLLIICGMVGGCSIEQGNRTKVRDITYEVVEQNDVPEELAAMIEEKKTADFKMTYETEDARYIVHGYGEQETGGYSICVRELYLTSNAIVFDTELIGPKRGETTGASPSYPCIIVKIEPLEENVIFE
jgi:hypothetical protein